MGVTSIRLNKKEEQVLNYLKEHFNCDSSTLLKKSMFELYEDLKDKEVIDSFEEKEANSSTEFIEFEDLLDD